MRLALHSCRRLRLLVFMLDRTYHPCTVDRLRPLGLKLDLDVGQVASSLGFAVFFLRDFHIHHETTRVVVWSCCNVMKPRIFLGLATVSQIPCASISGGFPTLYDRVALDSVCIQHLSEDQPFRN